MTFRDWSFSESMQWGLDDWSIDSRRRVDGFARANDDGNAHGMHMECVRVTVIYIYTCMLRAMRVARGLGRGVV